MATEPDPLPTDVICGRGNKKTTTSNPANIRFRALIEENKAAYQNSKHRDGKTKITCDVIDKMISEGSRFVVLDPTTNQWEAVSEEFTKEKVAHALRERPRQRKRKSMTTDDDDDADAAGTATNTSTSKRKVVATVTTIEENHKLRDFVTNTHDCYKVPPLTFYQWLLDHDIESLDNLCEACYEEEFVDTDMRMQGGLRLFKKKKFFKALMEAAPKAAAAAGAAATPPPQRATTNGSTFASMVLAATTMPHMSTSSSTSSEHSEDSTTELPTQHV